MWFMTSSNGSYDPQLMTKLHDSVTTRPSESSAPHPGRGVPPASHPPGYAMMSVAAPGPPPGYAIRHLSPGRPPTSFLGHPPGYPQGTPPPGYTAGPPEFVMVRPAAAAGAAPSRMQQYDHNCFKSALHHNKRSGRPRGSPCRCPKRAATQAEKAPKSKPPQQTPKQRHREPCVHQALATQCAHRQKPRPAPPKGDPPRVYHMYRSVSADRARDVCRQDDALPPEGWRSYETLRRRAVCRQDDARDVAHVKQALEHALVRSFQPHGHGAAPWYENMAWHGAARPGPPHRDSRDAPACSSLRDVTVPGGAMLQRSFRRARDENIYSSLRDVHAEWPLENSLQRQFKSTKPFRPTSAENVLHRSLKDLAALPPQHGSQIGHVLHRSLKDLQRRPPDGPAAVLRRGHSASQDAVQAPLWSFRPEPVYSSLDNVRLEVALAHGTKGPKGTAPALGRVAPPPIALRRDDSWRSHRGERSTLLLGPTPAPRRSLTPCPALGRTTPAPRKASTVAATCTQARAAKQQSLPLPPPPERTQPLCLRPHAFGPAGAPRRKGKKTKYQHLVDDNNNSNNKAAGGDTVVVVEKKPFAVEAAAALCPGCGQPPDVHVPPWAVASRPCGGLWSVDAALAALTLAGSLGNLVRLPRLVLQYGGGSFLAVYCATTLLLGVPLALLEVGLGQLCEQGVTRVWRAVPLFTGVGVVKVLVSAMLSVYWPVLMALSLFFAVWTAKGPVPFSECRHSSGAEGYLFSRTSGEACLKKTFLKRPVEEPMWFSVTATFLFLLWTIALLCVFRGARGYRRVLAVLLVSLVAGMVALLVDSALMPGADAGLETLLRFDWDVLLNAETWYFATVQIFFSTHIGFGNIVTGAGRFYSKSNAVWTAIALVVCSLLVGVLWVGIVFLRLGQIVQPSQLQQLVASDLPETLVLTLLYEAAARGNTDLIIAAVGFLVIVCAGFASLVPLLDTVLSAIHVESKRRWEWWKTAAVCCFIGFVLGALCMIPEWLSLIHVLDHYVVGRLALACTVTELVAFVWIYGCGPLYTDMEFVVGSKLGPLWKILWCLAPLYLLTIEAWSVVVMPWDGPPGRHDPPWQVLLGWGLYFAGWATICVTALRQVCIQVDYNICQKFLSAVKPSRNWGPADPIYRHCWMQWRDATPANKMDQTLRRRGTRDYTHSVRMATAPDPLTHFSHLSPSRGSGPFFIDSKTDLAEHVCWRKEIHDKPMH